MDYLNQIEFRALNRKGVEVLVNWAEEEGWNPGLNDAKIFWDTDPDGFIGCYYNSELIGGGSIVSYNGTFGFMGFFIMKPEFRSKGIGRKLWYYRRNKLIDRLKPGAIIGMDGVVAMQEFYKKGGFELAFRDERYERLGETFKIDPDVTSVSENDIKDIMLYDKDCFGYDRPQFMIPWLKQNQSQAFKYQQGDRLCGFAVLRKTRKGNKIGPLFADNAEAAEELYKACLNSAKGEEVYLDIPMVNKQTVELVSKYNAKYVFECARMYYGSPPEININKVFGITTFELG